jgi:hypothetical protein
MLYREIGGSMIKKAKRETRNSKFFYVLLILHFTFFIFLNLSPCLGVDADVTRQTIKGLRAVHVIVEEIQLNVQRYAQKAGITKEQIQMDVEAKLKANGFRVLEGDEWLKTPGKPVLYVNINTHETEKYWYAYNVNVELKQVVLLEANPSIKTLAGTWSINITNTANIGTLGIIKTSVNDLVDRFINACK